MYSSSHSTLSHLYLYMTPLFSLHGILVFWSHQEVLDSIVSFKINLHSMFTACFLYTFTDSFIVRIHHMWFLDVVARVLCALAVIVGCSSSPELLQLEEKKLETSTHKM